jgi:hypothetical protein
METPPLSPFVFVITFLAVFGLLVGLMPSEFLVATEEYREQDIPTEEFRVKDLEAYAETLMIPMNETGGKEAPLFKYGVTIDIGGHDCELLYTQANKTPLEIIFYHKYTVWWFVPWSHKLKWKNNIGLDRGDLLSVSELESDYADNLPYDLSCSHLSLDVSFNYNETTYSSVEDAWNHHGLSFFVGIEFDQIATGLNAWDMIGMILFFKCPALPFPLGYIIGVPIWVCIAWLSFAFIIAVIKSLPLT